MSPLRFKNFHPSEILHQLRKKIARKMFILFRNINGKRKVLHPLREKSKIGANKR